jgi:group I intron endonuclease
MGIIYKHTNKNDGSIYIGYSTYSMEERWKEHLRDSHCVNHKSYNTHFYNAIRKYGPDAFEHEVLEECSDELLDERETFWVEYHNTYEDRDHYNLTPGGKRRPSGIHVSDETRKKLSKCNKGKSRSIETRQKMSEAKSNMSIETRQKMSDAKKGKSLSEEHKIKISKAKSNISIEIRQRMSEGQKCKIVSNETRQRMSEAQKCRKRNNCKKEGL